MHRVEDEEVFVNQAGQNQFKDGPPGTNITADILNTIQEEIANAIEGGGENLFGESNDTRDQLNSVINAIVGDAVLDSIASTYTTIVSDTNTEEDINYIPAGDALMVELTLPSSFTSNGNFVGVLGKDHWKVKGNYRFTGYLKKLLSSNPGDSVKLVYDGEGIGIEDSSFLNVKQIAFVALGNGNTTIDYFDMTILSGNAINRGTGATLRLLCGVTGIQYGFLCGGITSVAVDSIGYIDLTLSTGNSAVRGTLNTAVRSLYTNIASMQYGFVAGGVNAASANIADIQYFDQTLTTGNASDGGDLTSTRAGHTGIGGPKYGYVTEGGAGLNIDYFDMISLTANAIDGGDLTAARSDAGCTKSSRYAFIAGGNGYLDIIEYLDMTTATGNALDGGDLTTARRAYCGSSGEKHGYWFGGFNGGNLDVIDYIDMTTLTTDAEDRGNLIAARREHTGL